MFFCGSCYVSDELPPDQTAWEYDLPSNNGLNQLRLSLLDDQISSGSFEQIDGLIIIKNDKLVFENYYDDDVTRATLLPIGRATTLVAAFTLGLLLEKGYIENIDVPIHIFLPEYQNIFDADSSKQEITFRHLLNNQMGIPWNEYTVDTESTSSHFYQMQLESDWTSYVLSKRMESEPGTRIVLNSASAIVLSKAFSNALPDDQSLEDFIDEELFNPIGIENYVWEYDLSGTLNLATGLSISTLDFTRLGYLMLQEGRWSDRHRVVNRDWILDVISPSTPFLSALDFGYYWWVFTDDFTTSYVDGNTAYMIGGYLGQTLYIVPDHNLVISVMAENHYSDLLYNSSLDIFLTITQDLTTTEES